MSDVLNNLKIRTRVALAFLLPVLAILAFSGTLLLEKRQVASEMAELQALVDLAPVASELVHQLQKERGTSAGYIGSKGGASFRDRLSAQRQATDQAKQRFDAAIAVFDVAAYDSAFEQRVRSALDQVAGLDSQRRGIDELATDVGAMATYYSSTIARLLDVVAEMAVISSDARVTNMITAYISVLQAKERTGIERAMGTNGFSAGAFAPVVYQRYVQTIAQQEAFLSVFSTYAAPDQREFYANTVRGPAVDEVERLRRIALDSPYSGTTQGVDGAHWFDTITAKIDLLKKVEDRIASDLQGLAGSIRQTAKSTFLIATGLTFGLLIVTSLVLVIIGGGITGPLNRLKSVMMALAGGDYGIDIPYVSRKDELGAMASTVAIFKTNALEKIRLEREQLEREQQEAKVCAEEERRALTLKIADDFETSVKAVVRAVSSAATELQGNSQSMSAVAEQTNQEAVAVASAIEQASGNVQTVASAAEELNASIAEIGRQVSESATIASAAVEEARRTNVRVEGLRRRPRRSAKSLS